MKSGNPGLGIGLVFILMVGCLIGFTALSVTWRSSSWPVVSFLVEFALAVIALAALGGAILQGLVGHGKGRASNLTGLGLILLLLGISALIFYAFTVTTPKALSTWEKTVETASLSLGAGGGLIAGRSIALGLFSGVRPGKRRQSHYNH